MEREIGDFQKKPQNKIKMIKIKLDLDTQVISHSLSTSQQETKNLVIDSGFDT